MRGTVTDRPGSVRAGQTVSDPGLKRESAGGSVCQLLPAAPTPFLVEFCAFLCAVAASSMGGKEVPGGLWPGMRMDGKEG